MAQMEDKVAVYIGMTSFSGNRMPQRGYEINDSKHFPESLINSLGFRFVQNHNNVNKNVFPNVKTNEIDGIIEQTKKECKNASMLLVVISSHGREIPKDTGGPDKEYIHQIALFDENIETTKLVNKFYSCIDSEKPKIFIIQACRNRRNEPRQDKGLALILTDHEPDQDFSAYQPPPETGHDESRGVVIPVCVQNSLVVFSSVSGFQSIGLDTSGGWFLSEFRDQLKAEEIGEFSLLEFLTRVNQRMSDRKASSKDDSQLTGCKAVASITFKLTSDITLKKIK